MLPRCAMCGSPIPRRPHQSLAARACSPQCATLLRKHDVPNVKEILDTTTRFALPPGHPGYKDAS